MAESLASNDVWATEAPNSSVQTTWERPVTKQRLPQVAVTPPSSSPKSTQSTPKAFSYAQAARPRKDQPPPATGPKHPVTPKPVTPIPVIPKLPGDAEAAAKSCKVTHDAAVNAQVEDLKRQIAERDAQIAWLKVQLQAQVARQFFGLDGYHGAFNIFRY